MYIQEIRSRLRRVVQDGIQGVNYTCHKTSVSNQGNLTTTGTTLSHFSPQHGVQVWLDGYSRTSPRLGTNGTPYLQYFVLTVNRVVMRKGPKVTDSLLISIQLSTTPSLRISHQIVVLSILFLNRSWTLLARMLKCIKQYRLNILMTFHAID